MSLQLPNGTTHILSNNGLAFLPPFVRARLNYLADMLDWREDEEDEVSFSYYEVRGMLSDGHYTHYSGTCLRGGEGKHTPRLKK